jgi:RNA polymerase sigma-70 factor, ECF subfamily
MKITPKLLRFASEDSEVALPMAGILASPRRDDRPEAECLVIRLFDLLQGRLLSYALTFGLSIHDAQEVVQETFLALFLHLQRGRPETNLTGWLFRVAHNLAIRRRMENGARERQFVHEEVWPEYPDLGQNAEDAFAFHQTHRCLRAVFEALPETDRQCLHLRAEGLKYRQIATILGISLGAVSNSLSRSLARMMRAIDGR